MKKLISVGILLACSAPLAAAEFAADHNGAPQIARGDYAAAERVLMRSLKVDADDPELLLNLATVYARTQRSDQAKALYRQVLAAPDERLSMNDGGTLRAHIAAQSGLNQLAGITLAAR